MKILYKHIKQKLKYILWTYIYSDELGVPGIRVKYNFYNSPSTVIPYKYLLRFIAKQLTENRLIYGKQDLLLKTSINWEREKDNINISPISKQLLNHLFYKLQYNDPYILRHIGLDNYYKTLYNKKIKELNNL